MKILINYKKCNLLSFNYIFMKMTKNQILKDFKPNFIKI